MINVSDNQRPDASRHFSSSARELMINLIKTLVPKKDFQLWCEDNNLIKEDGNPTFYGSLQYICRKINHDPIKEFIHLDLRALNKLFKALNSEVHEKKSLLTEIQMSALLSRIGGSILYLIDIDNQN